MNFKDNLRHYRELAGISSKEMAQKLEISYTTYLNYENKDSEPRYKTLCKIASLLNVTPNNLLGFAEKDETQKYIDVCNGSGNKAEMKFIENNPVPYIELTLKSGPSICCTLAEFSQIMKNALSDSYYEQQKEEVNAILNDVLNIVIGKSVVKYIISTDEKRFSKKAVSTIKKMLTELS